jgi:hypothetical protein
MNDAKRVEPGRLTATAEPAVGAQGSMVGLTPSLLSSLGILTGTSILKSRFSLAQAPTLLQTPIIFLDMARILQTGKVLQVARG